MPDASSQLTVFDPPAGVMEAVESDARETDADVDNDGTYLGHNPTWHTEDSAWKAKQILKLLADNRLSPKTVCEVGCGAGEILVQLKRNLADDCRFCGYDISPQAHALAATRADDRLEFHLRNLLDEPMQRFDLLMAIDLVEHVDDYLGLLRGLLPRAEYKIFHIPLDLSAYTVLRSHPILDIREEVGHIHYFTTETALAALCDTGYEIVQWCYPPDDAPLAGMPVKQKILALLRRGLFRLNADFSVRALGGRSLLVLAR